jgi:hypothetical protein
MVSPGASSNCLGDDEPGIRVWSKDTAVVHIDVTCYFLPMDSSRHKPSRSGGHELGSFITEPKTNNAGTRSNREVADWHDQLALIFHAVYGYGFHHSNARSANERLTGFPQK